MSRLDRAYRRLGPRYPRVVLRVIEQLNYLIILLSISVLALYLPMSIGEFLRLTAVGALMAIVYTAIYDRVAQRMVKPLNRWLEGAKGEQETREAWRAAAGLPREMLREELSPRSLGFAVVAVNVIWTAYATWELDFPAITGPLLLIGVLAYMIYTLILRFLIMEWALRPVVAEVADALPDEGPPPGDSIPLRLRLLAALPAINVFTGIVATGLAGEGGDLGDLAVAVGASTLVAGTVSLTVTLLLADSVTRPVANLRDAAESVGGGELSARVPVLTTDETGELSFAFNRMAEGLAERERIRDTLGTYVDRDVAEHILAEGTDLGGEEVEVTMMFLDIRDFTGYAEKAEASKVVETLNRLWEVVVPVIHDHGGHVDKFVGDGLLAVFGAPRRQEDHAERALDAAVELAGKVEQEFGGEIEVGVGLNSGQVVAGNVGGGGRLEFSVIGDAVNVAARIEAATRQTGDTILLAARTKDLLDDDGRRFEERRDLELKGKREEVRVYAPAGE